MDETRAPYPKSTQFRARAPVECGVVLAGASLLWWGWIADAHWFELHWLGHYCARDAHAFSEILVARVAAALGGLFLVFVARAPIGRWSTRHAPIGLAKAIAPSLGAVLLALLVCELVLRHRHPLLSNGQPTRPDFPATVASPETTWTLTPSRTTTATIGERQISYAVNADGARVARQEDTFDRERPTILFFGESITVGFAVSFAETYAALVGEDLGVQAINFGVHGFGNDQAYRRMTQLLPYFSRVIAVVSLFVPNQLARNVSDCRERLALGPDGSLVLAPPAPEWLRSIRLRTLWQELVPYHDDQAVELTKAILHRTVTDVRARGAAPLFVVTHCGPACVAADGESPWITKVLFEDERIPHVRVDFDPASATAGGDVHPDATVHRRIAVAIETTLRNEGVQASADRH